MLSGVRQYAAKEGAGLAGRTEGDAEVTVIDTTNAASITALAEQITMSIRRLSALARSTNEMSEMVAVLESLEASDGPVGALGDLFVDAAEWLQEFEDEDADTAADRLDETSGGTESVREGLDLALRLVRPLAG